MAGNPDRTARALDLGVLGAAVALCALGTALWGVGRDVAAVAAGGAVGFANWIALRLLLGGVFRPGTAGTPRRAVLAFLLATKVLALAAIVYLLVAEAALPPVPLAVGYSALVIGLLGGAAVANRATPPAEAPGPGGGRA